MAPMRAEPNWATMAVLAKHTEKPLHIDMPFDEALERFTGTSPEERR